MAWWWIAILLVVTVAFGGYLSTTAGRIDRLHLRIEAARAALEAQLTRRTGVVNAICWSRLLDPASTLLLAEAAAGASAAGALESGPLGIGDGAQPRALAESELSRALAATFDDRADVEELARTPRGAELVAELEGACRRVQLARRFLGDAVGGTRNVRRLPLVRWFRLAGRTPWPSTIELDDATPAGFTIR